MILALRGWAAADRFDWRQALLVGTALATGAVAAWNWWFAEQGSLRWDGRGWSFRSSAGLERAGRLAVALDLQQRMLLCFIDASDGRTCWLWLESGRAGGCWHELRCAAHARVAGDAACASTRPDPP